MRRFRGILDVNVSIPSPLIVPVICFRVCRQGTTACHARPEVLQVQVFPCAAHTLLPHLKVWHQRVATPLARRLGVLHSSLLQLR